MSTFDLRLTKRRPGSRGGAYSRSERSKDRSALATPLYRQCLAWSIVFESDHAILSMLFRGGNQVNESGKYSSADRSRDSPPNQCPERSGWSQQYGTRDFERLQESLHIGSPSTNGSRTKGSLGQVPCCEGSVRRQVSCSQARSGHERIGEKANSGSPEKEMGEGQGSRESRVIVRM
jgi:hypothetical protein